MKPSQILTAALVLTKHASTAPLLKRLLRLFKTPNYSANGMASSNMMKRLPDADQNKMLAMINAVNQPVEW